MELAGFAAKVAEHGIAEEGVGAGLVSPCPNVAARRRRRHRLERSLL